MIDGQAQVIAERCISCGSCITVCPQQAKSYRTEYGKVLQMMEDREPMAISLAPSFASYYSDWEQTRLPSALRMLGFRYVGETAQGAWHCATATRQYIQANPDQTHICSACPALVNYIRYKMPEVRHLIVPVVSPMIAHARLIREKFPELRVVFAGPCVAKKDESTWPGNEQVMDAVLTFEELDELFRLKNISFEQCEESTFDEQVNGHARTFPAEGGLLKTAGLSTDVLDQTVVAVSGISELRDVLAHLKEHGTAPVIIEPLFCENGCINGPLMKPDNNAFVSREKVLQYAATYPGHPAPDKELFEQMELQRLPLIDIPAKKYSEEQILEVLRKTGKNQPEDELNCTACGYPSCREKAIAVLDEMAELEMCVPYMRRLAEQKFDLILDRDPNGIVLLNDRLEILHMNPAFKKMFNCTDVLNERKISYLIDPFVFEKLITEHEAVVRCDVQYPNYNLDCHLVVYALPEQNQVVGVFVDITDNKSNKEKLNMLKAETVMKAQELMEYQIRMAQQMTRFLAENTAQGEVLMNNLIDSIRK